MPDLLQSVCGTPVNTPSKAKVAECFDQILKDPAFNHFEGAILDSLKVLLKQTRKRCIEAIDEQTQITLPLIKHLLKQCTWFKTSLIVSSKQMPQLRGLEWELESQYVLLKKGVFAHFNHTTVYLSRQVPLDSVYLMPHDTLALPETLDPAYRHIVCFEEQPVFDLVLEGNTHEKWAAFATQMMACLHPARPERTEIWALLHAVQKLLSITLPYINMKSVHFLNNIIHGIEQRDSIVSKIAVNPSWLPLFKLLPGYDAMMNCFNYARVEWKPAQPSNTVILFNEKTQKWEEFTLPNLGWFPVPRFLVVPGTSLEFLGIVARQSYFPLPTNVPGIPVMTREKRMWDAEYGSLCSMANI